MSEAILEITKLNKSFGPVHVLHDVDFKVYPGEVTALVGDNGAGKSTLVKCIAGINGYDSGEITFEGKHVVLGLGRRFGELEPTQQQIVSRMFGGRLELRLGTYDPAFAAAWQEVKRQQGASIAGSG